MGRNCFPGGSGPVIWSFIELATARPQELWNGFRLITFNMYISSILDLYVSIIYSQIPFNWPLTSFPMFRFEIVWKFIIWIPPSHSTTLHYFLNLHGIEILNLDKSAKISITPIFGRRVSCARSESAWGKLCPKPAKSGRIIHHRLQHSEGSEKVKNFSFEKKKQLYRTLKNESLPPPKRALKSTNFRPPSSPLIANCSKLQTSFNWSKTSKFCSFRKIASKMTTHRLWAAEILTSVQTFGSGCAVLDSVLGMSYKGLQEWFQKWPGKYCCGLESTAHFSRFDFFKGAPSQFVRQQNW